MSILNGLGAFGAGLSSFATTAMQDEEERPSLLNRAPPPPVKKAAPEPEPTQEQDTQPPPSSRAGVPDALLPIYQAASKRTGIPVEVLIAQGKQESNFNPIIIGNDGEIGLHQIKPSTARDPGFGMRGIDPATLKDPVVNINFAADYLKARAGSPNFNDPKSVDAALASYNGGGDKSYVQNVRRWMAAPAARIAGSI